MRVVLDLTGDERHVLRLLKQLLRRLLRDHNVRCTSITTTTEQENKE
jgi:hypothetical protein